MRTPPLAALALLAPALAAAAAPGPASAEPLRLDEGRLAGVAAGQVDTAAPGGMNISSLTSSSTTNSSSNAVDTRMSQMLAGVTDNSNTALGVNSSGVAADGTAATMVTGTITGLLGAR